MELTPHSSGVAKAGLTTGIIGTSLGVLNGAGGLLGSLFGGGYGGWGMNRGCGGYGYGYSDYAVNRFNWPKRTQLRRKTAKSHF